MTQFLIEPYNSNLADEWNRFVNESRNGTFLFNRGYMDYHSDRFKDLSLIIRNNKGHILALFAAAEGEDVTTVTAHSGLTYGGLILPYSITAVEIGTIISDLLDYYRNHGFGKLIYKPVPHIYHKYPTEEDIYFLVKFGAKITECRLSSTFSYVNPPRDKENTRRNIKRAAKEKLTYSVATIKKDWESFYSILSSTLASRHKARPVHSLNELFLLRERFPENINLWLASDQNGIPLAGMVLYLTDRVVHAQYIAASPEGFEKCALPGLIDSLMDIYSHSGKYFDFGTSNEDHGRILNEGLIRQKSGFGARGTIDMTLTLDF